MEDLDLRADCRRCAAICCVALGFSHSTLFAFDKPAGAPCAYLARRRRGGASAAPTIGCAVHPSLRQRGLAGCAGYDCAGAGQRITEDLFDGKSFWDEPDLLAPTLDAFATLRDAHEHLALVVTAGSLPLSRALRSVRQRLLDDFAPGAGPERRETLARALAGQTSGELPARTRAFLSSLRDLAPRRLPVIA